ncbi:MAG TPA: FHA domain-containing protein [Vicinamibacteria bacterium]|nr:FHA domain-containing protein [Vicinamibacteria bacterium]
MNQAPCSLVWQRPDGVEVRFALQGESLTVGRDETADIRVNEPLVSRAHARLERQADGFRVVDLGSTNLTRVNGEAVQERLLHHGDELRFARARCRFVIEGEDPVARGV